MAVKTITITEDAYARLATLKEPNESFSDVVKRLTGTGSLLELDGVLSGKEAMALERSVQEIRKNVKARMEKVMQQFK